MSYCYKSSIAPSKVSHLPLLLLLETRHLFPKTVLLHNNMVLPIEFLMSLGKPEYIETWIRCFAVLIRVKKLKDQKASGGENEIIELFVKPQRKYQSWYTLKYERKYEEISAIIKRNVHPKQKLIITERTKFFETRQNQNLTAMQYLHMLCFDLLTRPKMPFKVMHRKEVTHSNGSYERKSCGRKLADEMGRARKIPMVHYRVMHWKRVTSELHDSYFHLMMIKHSISKIEWALNDYIIQLRSTSQSSCQ